MTLAARTTILGRVAYRRRRYEGGLFLGGGNSLVHKMRAVRKLGPGPGAQLVEVEVPRVGPHDILVQISATSICGTDYHIFRWDPWSEGRVKTPLTLGHEFSGRVVEIGPEVHHLRTGDHVSAETHVTCGRCLACLTGQAHVCQETRILGVDRDGAFAEFVAIPAANAWVNDPDLSPELASIQEPLGNAVHTALAQPLVARSVLVMGCGPIGLMAVAVARQAGAQVVIAVDITDYRLRLARELGASEAIDATKGDPVARVRELTRGSGADVLLEMSGHPTGISQGLRALRPGGEASLLGLPSAPFRVDWGNEIVLKGLTLRGITGRRIFETWHQVRALLRAGLELSPLITHRLPLERFAEGMNLIASGRCGKVILYP